MKVKLEEMLIVKDNINHETKTHKKLDKLIKVRKM